VHWLSLSLSFPKYIHQLCIPIPSVSWQGCAPCSRRGSVPIGFLGYSQNRRREGITANLLLRRCRQILRFERSIGQQASICRTHGERMVVCYWQLIDQLAPWGRASVHGLRAYTTLLRKAKEKQKHVSKTAQQPKSRLEATVKQRGRKHLQFQ